MENKFFTQLKATNKEIKANRAKIITEDVIDASEELLRSLRLKRRELERKLLNLSDMHPNSELSLRVVKDDFNAKNWIASIQQIKIQMANNAVELALAEATHAEWFTDEQGTTKA